MATKRSTPGATLIKIDKAYPVGSNDHYSFCYLAKTLVGGTAHSDLSNMKLSLIKQTVFDKQHSKESISLMRMLLLECGDKKSSDMLKEFDTNSSLFMGETVEENQRISYNFHHLLVYVATNLDDNERVDMITLLRDVVDCEEKKNDFQTLLFSFERASQGNKILPQELDQLKDWLSALDRQDLVRKVNQFDPKKQFPGLEPPIPETGVAIPEFQRQCSDSTRGGSTTVPKVLAGATKVAQYASTGRQESDDSAYGEGDPRERSGSHGDPQSMGSKRTE